MRPKSQNITIIGSGRVSVFQHCHHICIRYTDVKLSQIELSGFLAQASIGPEECFDQILGQKPKALNPRSPWIYGTEVNMRVKHFA